VLSVIPQWPQEVAILLVCLATLVVGAVGFRLSHSTSDFYVASRAVSPTMNASAIGGEYLSAASFLGVAGLVLAYGADMLWYPVGYTAGYIVLLALVAAPLRRSGAYTLPDFAEIRLQSRAVRHTASVLVVGIGWLYLLPQFQGAGLALRTVTGAPEWVGTALVASIVVLNVASGGMRSITFVQAFQYWLKLTAISLPVIFLLLAWQSDGGPDPARAGLPTTRTATSTVLPSRVKITVDRPVTLTVHGRVDGERVDGEIHLVPGEAVLSSGTTVTMAAGTVVPHATALHPLDGDAWVTPGNRARDYSAYRIYSLLLGLLFGTMGLPHVLVRFYTNPDGRAARRTTLVVVALLGVFYLFPPIYGMLGRLYTPDLLLMGRPDAVVLFLPGRLLAEPWASLVTALVTAGAFAAFLSTSSGLTVSVAGVLNQDVLRGRIRASVGGFRLAALMAVCVPALLSLGTMRLTLADTVSLAFAVAASTFCPMLLLGIWWRPLTARGAMAGLLTGGILATAAVVATMVIGPTTGLFGALMAQPAAWTVPLAFTAAISVSLATRRGAARTATPIMVRLHTPEDLDLDRGAGPRRR